MSSGRRVDLTDLFTSGKLKNYWSAVTELRKHAFLVDEITVVRISLVRPRGYQYRELLVFDGSNLVQRFETERHLSVVDERVVNGEGSNVSLLGPKPKRLVRVTATEFLRR